MTILLCGEGKNDVGFFNQGTGKWENGVIQTLIHKIAGTVVSIDFICIDRHTINPDSPDKTHRFGRKRLENIKGHGIFAHRFAIYAKENSIQYDIIGLYKDTDKKSKTAGSDKKTAIESHNEIIEDIHRGFAEVDGCNNYFAIVPIRMIENWLLCDINAFKSISRVKSNISLTSNAEFIWGEKDDPQSNYPKNYLVRILNEFELADCTETYIELADKTDISKLIQKSISFTDFFNELMTVVNQVKICYDESSNDIKNYNTM